MACRYGLGARRRGGLTSLLGRARAGSSAGFRSEADLVGGSELTVRLPIDFDDESAALQAAAAELLGVPRAEVPPVLVKKRSLDCRHGRSEFQYSLEIGCPEAPAGVHRGSWPGAALGAPPPTEPSVDYPVAIVGSGPCGLFCAYQLARFGIAATVFERGKPVQARRHDLRGLTQRGSVDPDSNYCFGEGGAGTYSDGKLYTRAHKRGDVRDILEILALHGAPEEILIDARPHIGTNRLPQVITGLRHHLESVGVRFEFGSRVSEVEREAGSGRASGVRLASGAAFEARAVVLATGHSATGVYRHLHATGHPLQFKSFAVGVRIEHPQPLINAIQYGSQAGHPRLPSAAYRLVDSHGRSSVFSFCMCPGGFIVPAATETGQVVVNGMSPSSRNSRYANSGLVVSVGPAEMRQAGLAGPLAGLEFQRRLEAAAFEAGGGGLRAPATRAPDFMARRASTTTPRCSYVPGLAAGNLAEVLGVVGPDLALSLGEALGRFGKRLRGYLSEEAVLVGVETRTSAPVRIPRDSSSLESPFWPGVFPAGEGAGYAGGIVSAAADGMRVARQIAQRAGVL